MNIDFQELADESERICSWIESFGLQVNPTRIARYREKLTQIAENLAQDTPEILNSDMTPYLQALFEYSELSVIYHAFVDNPAPGIDGLLKKLVSGPFSYIQETNKSTAARNFAFEATLGARIALADLPVSFRHTGDVFSDATGFPIYFQCKRCTSLKQIRVRVSDALKQLEKDIKKHRGSRAHGLVALDITKLNNPDGITMIADNTLNIESQNRGFRDAFIHDYIEDLKVKPPKKVIGIIVRSAYLCFDKQSGMYAYDQGYTFSYLEHTTAKEKDILSEFIGAVMVNTTPRRLTKQ